MSIDTIIYGSALVILGTVAILVVPNVPIYFAKKRLFRRFALLHCGSCQVPFGIEAVRSGKNVSPFEELWSDGKDHNIHCHPTCLLVACPQCSRRWVLRYNSEGEQFGPELSVGEPTREPEPLETICDVCHKADARTRVTGPDGKHVDFCVSCFSQHLADLKESVKRGDLSYNTKVPNKAAAPNGASAALDSNAPGEPPSVS